MNVKFFKKNKSQPVKQLGLNIAKPYEKDRNYHKGGRSFYFFDFDDNIAILGTPTYLFHKETGDELILSSGEFAQQTKTEPSIDLTASTNLTELETADSAPELALESRKRKTVLPSSPRHSPTWSAPSLPVWKLAITGSFTAPSTTAVSPSKIPAPHPTAVRWATTTKLSPSSSLHAPPYSSSP